MTAFGSKKLEQPWVVDSFLPMPIYMGLELDKFFKRLSEIHSEGEINPIKLLKCLLDDYFTLYVGTTKGPGQTHKQTDNIVSPITNLPYYCKVG